MHKLFVFTQILLIVVARLTFPLCYPYWLITSLCFVIRKYNELNHRDCAQININSGKKHNNSGKKHNTMTSVLFPDHRTFLDRLQYDKSYNLMTDVYIKLGSL